MSVDRQLLKVCEEFFESIAPAVLERNPRAEEEFNAVRALISDHADTGGDESETQIIRDIKGKMLKIGFFISRSADARAPGFRKRQMELHEHLDYLIDESSESDAVEEDGSSWKEEYLRDNSGDDFYEDPKRESDTETDDEGVYREEEACC